MSLLEGSLIEQADKQTKAKKRADRLKAEQEQQRENNAARHNFPGSGSNGGTRDGDDPLLANTSAMLRGVSDYDDTDNGRNDLLVGRKANVAAGVDGATGSGIDSALNALSMGGNKCGGAAEDDLHPEKRMKALHKAYEERMMPQMKMEYPGLRLAQYKEKIFHMWRKSPENPMNWPKKP